MFAGVCFCLFACRFWNEDTNWRHLHISALSPLTISPYLPSSPLWHTALPGNQYMLDQMKDEIFTLVGKTGYRTGHAHVLDRMTFIVFMKQYLTWHQVGFDSKLSRDVGVWVQLGGGWMPGHGLRQRERGVRWRRTGELIGRDRSNVLLLCSTECPKWKSIWHDAGSRPSRARGGHWSVKRWWTTAHICTHTKPHEHTQINSCDILAKRRLFSFFKEEHTKKKNKALLFHKF